MMHKTPTVEEVDYHMLRRFDELVQDANPEDLAKLLDSWSKYISARRNNDAIPQQETVEEKQARETADILEAEIG